LAVVFQIVFAEPPSRRRDQLLQAGWRHAECPICILCQSGYLPSMRNARLPQDPTETRTSDRCDAMVRIRLQPDIPRAWCVLLSCPHLEVAQFRLAPWQVDRGNADALDRTTDTAVLRRLPRLVAHLLSLRR